MQLSTRRMLLVFGGSILLTLGAVAACTDNATTPLPSSGDGGPRSDGGKKADGDTDPPDDEQDGGEAGADCKGINRPTLRNNEDGFRCPFSKRLDAGTADAGGAQNCFNDEICCNSGEVSQGKFGDSFCAPKGPVGTTAAETCQKYATDNNLTWVVPKSRTWECLDSAGCGGTGECCLYTWDGGADDKVNIGLSSDAKEKACGVYTAFKHGGTRCQTTCGANEIKTCSDNDDTCGTKKCLAFVATSRDMGHCK